MRKDKQDGEQSDNQAASEQSDVTKALTITQSEERDLKALAQRANSIINTKNPTQKEVALLREVMELIPGVACTVGNISYQARQRLIGDMSSNIVIEENIQKEVERLEGNLGYKDAPTIEQLLIRQISVCWLALYQTQQVYTTAMAKSLTIAQAMWHERWLTMSQGRFLRAVESLAKVRKLARGSTGHTLMLNVAQQQINAAISG